MTTSHNKTSEAQVSVRDYLAPHAWLRSGAGPRYNQLRQRLEQGIEAGVFPANSALLPERELAQITGLSRVTVRKAIHALVERGIIVQRQGSGSYVADAYLRFEQSLSYLSSFTEDMDQRGLEVGTKWLGRGVFLANETERQALELPDGASVARIERLRMANQRPMAIERAALPEAILPNPMEVETSLYETLERQGKRPVKAVQKISAALAGQNNATLLQLDAKDAVLKIERISRLANGTLVEFTQSIYRADAYEFVAEMKIG